jgi:RimJ/RimL family protein N-acetyltransferase
LALVPIHLPIPTLEGLETDRLRFRRLRPEDADWWMEYINSAEAIRFMPFRMGSSEDCAVMIQRSLDRYAKDGSGLHAVLLKAEGRPVGQCGLLTQVVDDIDELEIGYHLLPTAWGHGYATEAALACKQFAQERRLVPSVVSLIDPDNHPSQRVAMRNGMNMEKRTLHRGLPALVFRVALGSA